MAAVATVRCGRRAISGTAAGTVGTVSLIPGSPDADAKRMSHLLLIDGSNLVHRAYYANSALVTSKGIPSGAVHGFSWMLFNLVRQAPRTKDYSHAVVAFDLRRANWRHAIDPGYKGSRFKKDERLTAQFDLCMEAVAAFGMTAVDAHGFEADDIVATYVDRWQEIVGRLDDTARVTIVSSDKDLMQLVGDRVAMLDTLPRPSKLYTVDEVVDRWGVFPGDVPLLLAIAGDSSDNIDGIQRVGPVTAAKWVKKYGGEENLLKALSAEHRKIVAHNLRLVRLRRDVPSLPDLAQIVASDDVERLVAFLDKMEFTRLKRYVLEAWGLPAAVDRPIALHETVERFI